MSSVRRTLAGVAIIAALSGESSAISAAEVRLMTLDPGHFHAGLVQKSMYPEVSPIVHVYAPGGPDLDEHLKRIQGFNSRADNPTSWDEKVYAQPDFLERMIKDKPGNVVVLSGNNARKTEYIYESVKAGFHVYADKPMAISPAGFKLLQQAFGKAADKRVMLYDIMTERFEITSILQRELAMVPEVFGALETGSPENPAVVMESVHHYFKEVAGKPLIRPAWFFDVRQQGEAIPDVGTHLVDLVQWECFPGQAIDWKKDLKVTSAARWPTRMTLDQFRLVTGLNAFPDFLKKDVGPDGTLAVYQNGDVAYRIRGVHAKVTALWKFEAPPGAKDTHYSVLKGSKAILTIKQGPEEKYIPALYVSSKGAVAADFERALKLAVERLAQKWPGIGLHASQGGWEVTVPDKYNVGHEAHFAQVTSNYLKYLSSGSMPAWEVPNMLAKYYVSTQALRLAQRNSKRP